MALFDELILYTHDRAKPLPQRHRQEEQRRRIREEAIIKVEYCLREVKSSQLAQSHSEDLLRLGIELTQTRA